MKNLKQPGGHSFNLEDTEVFKDSYIDHTGQYYVTANKTCILYYLQNCFKKTTKLKIPTTFYLTELNTVVP